MADLEAGRVKFSFLGDTSNLVKGLDTVQSKLSEFQSSSQRVGQAIGGRVNTALDTFADLARGGAAAAGVVAGGFAAVAAAAIAVTKQIGAQTEAIDFLSQQTGLSIQTLQRWKVAMAENGVSTHTVATSMRTLSKQLIEAKNPASDAAQAFEDIGLSVNQLGSTETVIRALADRFKDMADGPEKTAMAVKFLGRSALEMIPILNRGAAAFDASAKQSERFGLVLSGQQVQALTAADDATDRLSMALEGLKTQLAVTFAPSVTDGTNAITDGIARITAAIRELREEASNPQTNSFLEFLKNYVPGAALLGSLTGKLIKGPTPPPPAPPPGPLQDAHVQAQQANMTAQVAEGLRLRKIHITAWQQAQAVGRAEEALGRVKLEMIQNEMTVRSQALADRVSEEQRLYDLQQEFSKPPSSGPFVEEIEKRRAAVTNLMNIMPELSQAEADVLYFKNQSIGESVLNQEKQRRIEMEKTVSTLNVLADAEDAWASNAAAAFQQFGGSSEQAVTYAFQAIDARMQASRANLERQLGMQEIDYQEYLQRILQLDLQADEQRRQKAKEFPTFWGKQLQDLQASNVFSMGQLVSTWSSGMASTIVNAQNFGQAMVGLGKQTATAMLQGLIQFGIQRLAILASQASAETALATATAGIVMGINAVKTAAIMVGEAVAAVFTVATWEAAGMAIIGTFSTITGAIMGFMTETLIPVFIKIGTALMTFMTAIAEAAADTIFGIPYALAILAGVAVIGAAIGTIAAFAFADGGIATGPTLGMIGEAGDSEAVIPLNSRGAAFMSQLLGLRNESAQGSVVETKVYLDGRQIALATSDHTISVLRQKGLPV